MGQQIHLMASYSSDDYSPVSVVQLEIVSPHSQLATAAIAAAEKAPLQTSFYYVLYLPQYQENTYYYVCSTGVNGKERHGISKSIFHGRYLGKYTKHESMEQRKE